MILFFKAHVSGYTKTDGTVVAPHEDKRPAAPYNRFTNGEPMNAGVGYAMFADGDPERVDHYGKNHHTFDPAHLPDAATIDATDDRFISLLRVALEDTSYWSDEEISNLIDDSAPHDIVDSAAFWDNQDLVDLAWEKVLEPNGWLAVKTPDGAIVFDETAIRSHSPEITKAHPVTQAMTGSARPANLTDGDTRRNPGEPSRAQAEADTYSKPRVEWHGLTVAVENPAGSVRRGTNRQGDTWEIRMSFDYGEIVGTKGVDGDPVDVYMGPNLDAPMVYVVHQRRCGDWSKYDEDKCMVGFDSEDDAKAAFLANYSDARFLGPVTAMPVAEFVAKVKATRENPAMIKSLPVVLFFKARVGPYLRAGKLVNAAGYQGRDAHAEAGAGQLSLFFPPPVPAPVVDAAAPKTEPNAADKANPRKKYYVTMVRGPGTSKVGWLAGPFDRHEDALAHVEPAREMASKIDPWSDMDAFGTASLEADKHKPGVLNRQLGIGLPGKSLALSSGTAVGMPKQFTVSFGGKEYPVESLDDAQRKWITFRDVSGEGASGIGNGVSIKDQDGNTVASISYNGRLWDGDGDDKKLLAEAPEPNNKLATTKERVVRLPKS